MNIRPYAAADHPRLVSFLQSAWAPAHPLYNRAFFDWQYRTRTSARSVVIEDKGDIVGFAGVIPNDYLLRGVTVSGAAVALWVVAAPIRQSGLGVLMIQEIQRSHGITLSLRTNPTALKIYQGLGYSSLAALHRAVVPLQANGFHRLLEAPDAVPLAAIESWASSVPRPNEGSCSPERPPDAKDLETLFDRSVRPSFGLTVLRNADYWTWRYLDHPLFRYRFFGTPGLHGVLVGRVEDVPSDAAGLPGLRVFRLIEAIPSDPAVFSGAPDTGFERILIRALDVARGEGCVAADFQSSHTRLSHVLGAAGFRNQEPGDPATGLVQLFQPFRRGVEPINAVWHAGSPAVATNDTYFMKSDGDMDRPRVA